MDYLYKEHGFTQLEDPITKDEIVEYFMDMGGDFLECGEGFYTEEDTIKVFIEGTSYAVTIKGEIGSQKQDRGDRDYWIEDVTEVTYVEIPTPEPMPRKNYVMDDLINVTEDQFNQVLKAISKICK